ncbi:MAG: F0F1 ATP synthase subunit delta [Proteobacteria bacterium]|nr:F0F1 ATP synthase subunit delta [Pseudomonadota bacterium]
MAEVITLARPYAQALFSLAKETTTLNDWSNDLDFLKSVANDDDFRALIGAPDIKLDDIENLFLTVCADQVSAEACNFIQLLVRNGRLSVLGDVVRQYRALKAEDEGVVSAIIQSAFELDEVQVQKIVDIFSKKLDKRISPSVTIDPNLIGGVKVYVGDKVWDASVRGRLQHMAATLTN